MHIRTADSSTLGTLHSHKQLTQPHIIHTHLGALLEMYLMRQTQKGAKDVFNGIKMHILLHMDDFIKRFGTPQVWDTDSFESAHKEMVKRLYLQSSKRISRLEHHLLCRVRVNNIFFAIILHFIKCMHCNSTSKEAHILFSAERQRRRCAMTST